MVKPHGYHFSQPAASHGRGTPLPLGLSQDHGDTATEDRVGKFLFEGQLKADFEDRLLSHIQTVIGAKLRRGESFHFTWKDDQSIGDGRTSIWLHPGSVITYKYYGGRQPALNKAWIDALMYTANSPRGLYVVPEPAPSARLEGATDEAY